MRSFLRTSKRGQTALEYLLLFALVSFVVFLSFSKNGFISKVHETSNREFVQISRVIMGENPKPIDGGWCPWAPVCPTVGCAETVQRRTCECPAPAFGGKYCQAEGPNQLTAARPCPNVPLCTPCTKTGICVTSQEPACSQSEPGFDSGCFTPCTKRGPACPKCEGSLPANAALCPNDDKDIPEGSSISYTVVDQCSNSRKCEATCIGGSDSNEERTQCVLNQCDLSTMPANAQLCPGATDSVPDDGMPIRLVAQCPPSTDAGNKCQATCATGGTVNGTGCTFGCSGDRNLPNAQVCSSTETVDVGPGAMFHIVGVQTSAKCELCCINGSAPNSSKTACEMPVHSCSGNKDDFPNTELCSGDEETDVGPRTGYRFVTTPSSNKCELCCKSGMKPNADNTGCIEDKPMVCERSNWQTGMPSSCGASCGNMTCNQFQHCVTWSWTSAECTQPEEKSCVPANNCGCGDGQCQDAHNEGSACWGYGGSAIESVKDCCGDGVCADVEGQLAGPNNLCPKDCCGPGVPMNQSYMNNGRDYCRDINNQGYKWSPNADLTAACNEASEVCSSSYKTGDGSTYYCKRDTGPHSGNWQMVWVPNSPCTCGDGMCTPESQESVGSCAQDCQ